MVSFNTTVRQMTEIFQWPKCLKMFQWKKTAVETFHQNFL